MGACGFANEPRVSILNTVIWKVTTETHVCLGVLSLNLTPDSGTKKEFNDCILGYIP